MPFPVTANEKNCQRQFPIYKKYGFEECEPYYHNPMDDVVYMRKDL